MMKKLSFLIVAALTIGGCMRTVSANLDGRRVFAHSAPTSYAQIHSAEGTVVVTLGSKSVTVTKEQVRWVTGRSIALPSGWQTLEVQEYFDKLVIKVDGRYLPGITS